MVFWSVIFSATVYFSFWGLNNSTLELTRQTTKGLAYHLKSQLSAFYTEKKLENDLSADETEELEKFLRINLLPLDLVKDFLLVNKEGRVFFALNESWVDSVSVADFLTNPGENRKPRPIQLRKSVDGEWFDAIWQVTDTSVFAILRVNPKTGMLRSIRQNMTINLYLIGFSGIVGVIILALFSSRVVHSPLKKIDRALSAIDRRKYGHRLKWNSDEEFAEYYQTVNQALRRLEQLDTVQRNAVQRRNVVLNDLKTTMRFLDIMSHEIKNPLHALGINLDVLKTKIMKGQTKESTLKHAEILEQEIEHLQEVVLGFLSYVRPGIPKKERVHINNLIKDVSQMVSAEAQKAGLRIETRLSRNLKRVLIDPGQIKRALHNVVINAIHATGPKGKIHIRSWAKKNKVLVEVKDNGTGISKEDLRKILDLYYTTKKGGSGLGLPVTKRLVEANLGQMMLESSLGKGTKITFVFQT